MASRTDNFQKFVKQKRGSAVKEEIKQQKKKDKKERAAAIDAHYERKRAERLLQRQQPSSTVTPASTKPGRPNKYPKKAVEETKQGQQPSTVTPVSTKPGRPNKYPTKAVEETKQRQQPSAVTPVSTKPGRPNKYPKKAVEETKVTELTGKGVLPNKPVKTGKPTPILKEGRQNSEYKGGEPGNSEVMPLNKYIAHGGICSRRDAAIMVREGKVTVNGTPATDPGMKVSSTDVVKVGPKKVIPSRNFVYILLNKPKDYITTSEDPQGRKTVLDLVRSATSERVYPVGRLDRNTSGVLLLTNDGELAQKLSHPSHEVKKVYEVRLDRALTKADMDKIATGVTLEDGFVAPDVIAYADPKDKSIIGVEIHSGRNRIVRRIFEHMKYDVKGLDRVMFAGLTKKDVQRGTWRFLKEKEIRILKFMNQSFVKVKE